jgi:hypothetical protein
MPVARERGGSQAVPQQAAATQRADARCVSNAGTGLILRKAALGRPQAQDAAALACRQEEGSTESAIAHADGASSSRGSRTPEC